MSSSSHYFRADAAATLDPAELSHRQVTLAGFGFQVAMAPGVFAATKVDLGTQVLLRTVAGEGLPESGDLLDLGCGWGPLALTMARLAPGCTVWAVDVNPRAVALTQMNAAAAGLDNVRAAAPEQAAHIQPQVIWSNPPIRVGKAELHAMLRMWLEKMPDAGHADLVVQRHLGADSLAAWLTEAGFPTAKLASAKGYRVLRAHRRS